MWSHQRLQNWIPPHKNLKTKGAWSASLAVLFLHCLGTWCFSVPNYKAQSYSICLIWSWYWTFSKQAFQSHRTVATVERRRVHVNKFYIHLYMLCIWQWDSGYITLVLWWTTWILKANVQSPGVCKMVFRRAELKTKYVLLVMEKSFLGATRY